MRPIVAFSAILFCTGISAAQDPAANTGWTLNGSAILKKVPDGGGYRIRLTANQTFQAGSAFLTAPIAFGNGNTFSYSFQFQMTDPNSQASDGMTFVLQTAGPTALGANGGCLGYAGSGSDCVSPYTGGIMPSVAVEFDTWQNSPFDLNDNHVAILTNGQLDDTDPQTPYGVTNCQPAGAFGCMNNGDVWSVWINYDGASLHVALADDSSNRPPDLIDYPIDIPGILGGSSAYIGFSAGTGAGDENHYVMNLKPGKP
ncbi:MAG TPA: L-type lectin-domain containing protein [Bryobacteraceae bacterium]|nr:L-type lectin-domain containing protein [Bryobacteraceae bacterium]